MSEMLSIGTVARIFDMTKQGVRLYAKKNLVIPVRHENNDYRYYPSNYVGHLCKVRYLQSMGLSLSEIAEEMLPDTSDKQMSALKETLSYDGWIKSLAERREALKQEIIYKQDLLQRTEIYYEEALRIPELLDKYKIETSKEFLFWELSDANNNMHMTDLKILEAQKWIKLFPFTRYAFLCPKAHLKNNEKHSEVSRGLIIGVQDAEKHHIALSKSVTRLPAQTCYHTIIQTGVNDTATAKLLSDVAIFFEEHDFEIDGDILGVWLTNLIEEDSGKKYYDIWIPIRKSFV